MIQTKPGLLGSVASTLELFPLWQQEGDGQRAMNKPEPTGRCVHRAVSSHGKRSTGQIPGFSTSVQAAHSTPLLLH